MAAATWVILAGESSPALAGAASTTTTTEQPSGACCYSEGCVTVPEHLCGSTWDGVYKGDFTGCGDFGICDDGTTTTTVPIFGACCFVEGCVAYREADCLAGEGNYLGDFTECGPQGACPLVSTTTTFPDTTTTSLPATTTTTLPPDPLGACCFSQGCTETSELDCVEGLSGQFQGDGTVCNGPGIVGICDTTTTTSTTSTTTTTMPSGACCYGSLCDVVTAAGCTGDLFGTYQGDGTSCSEPGICVDCGSSCVDFGEECDDGNTVSGDGCDDKCTIEDCYKCTETPTARAFTTCSGESVCKPEVTAECAVCGDGEIYPGEDCEDGNTVDGDCCSSTCLYEESGSPCPDSVFCDGAETCDGSGLCVDAIDPADCSDLDGECATGVCDTELDACVADPEPHEGDPCSDPGECTVADSGTCEDGACVGEGTTLSPSCRWIVVGGSPEGDVGVRTGPGSMVDANTCGDTARWGGITSASIVATTAAGEGIRFYGPPVVDEDIVTGGSSAGGGLYLDVPGTAMKTVPGGSVVAKVPTGVVDTTGLHPLVGECNADKGSLPGAHATLGGMPSTDTVGDPVRGLKIPINGSATIDVTGDGTAVVEMANLKVSRKATLTLTGLASDVVMLRILGPRMVFGFNARLVLNGLVEENVLIYSQGRRCKISHEVTGGGTVFCPEATKFHVGVGARWTGSFLGGTREVRVRQTAELTHTPFTGF